MLDFIPHRWRHPLRAIFSSSEWIGTLWICIGLGLHFSVFHSDIVTVMAPIIIGIVCFIPFKQQKAVYFILVFAFMFDRIIFYLDIGAYGPIFAWLLLGTYIARKTR